MGPAKKSTTHMLRSSRRGMRPCPVLYSALLAYHILDTTCPEKCLSGTEIRVHSEYWAWDSSWTYQYYQQPAISTVVYLFYLRVWLHLASAAPGASATEGVRLRSKATCFFSHSGCELDAMTPFDSEGCTIHILTSRSGSWQPGPSKILTKRKQACKMQPGNWFQACCRGCSSKRCSVPFKTGASVNTCGHHAHS
eukprot:3451452-Pleurochrysis_carterae.AAC.1